VQVLQFRVDFSQQSDSLRHRNQSQAVQGKAAVMFVMLERMLIRGLKARRKRYTDIEHLLSPYNLRYARLFERSRRITGRGREGRLESDRERMIDRKKGFQPQIRFRLRCLRP
jgi:hypothetical protein